VAAKFFLLFLNCSVYFLCEACSTARLVALRINEWKVLTALSQYIRLRTISSLASVLAVGVKASPTLGFLAEALLNALSVAKSVNIGGVSLALAVNAFSAVSLLASLSARFSTTAVGRVAEFAFLYSLCQLLENSETVPACSALSCERKEKNNYYRQENELHFLRFCKWTTVLLN
jgi:hypothetical protein